MESSDAEHEQESLFRNLMKGNLIHEYNEIKSRNEIIYGAVNNMLYIGFQIISVNSIQNWIISVYLK